MTGSSEISAVLIAGARVFRWMAMFTSPEADLLVVGDRIAAIRKGLANDLRAGRRIPELPVGACVEQIDGRGNWSSQASSMRITIRMMCC